MIAKEKISMISVFGLYMVLGLILLLIATAASVTFGAADMPMSMAWEAVFKFDPAITNHQIIRTLRLPRTVADIIVGCSLAVCGAIMQGTTRNPLADSGLMGISAGATFAIALSMTWIPLAGYEAKMVFAFAGAALATGLTYMTASIGKRKMSAQRMVLAGISISTLFSAFSQYLSIRYNLGQSLAFWTAGGTAGADWNELIFILPFFIVSLCVAIAISPSVTLLNLGEEVSLGLGLNIAWIKGISTILVLVMTGLSVVLVGPVSFVGLVVPHIVRYMVGVDYRYIIPASALYGGLFTLLADIIGRMINRPFETPIGIILSLIGVPYFLYLARKQRREKS